MNCKPSVNQSSEMVPEGGFEPPTRGFSILALTLKNKDNFVNQRKNGLNGINSLQNSSKPSNAEIIADLARVRAAFQLRTIELVLREG